jgi:hypothetical protein
MPDNNPTKYQKELNKKGYNETVLVKANNVLKDRNNMSHYEIDVLNGKM